MNANEQSRHANQQRITNPRTGKIERVFVNLEAVYPNESDEMSFDELRAKARGWLDQDWAAKARLQRAEEAASRATAEASMMAAEEPKLTSMAAPVIESQVSNDSPGSILDSTRTLDLGHTTAIDLGQTIAIDLGLEGKAAKPKKMKIKEVKRETQTSKPAGNVVKVFLLTAAVKTNLASPTGPKLRRKTSAEPTMTLHTKAATEDILDIFNQPLRNVDPMAAPDEDDGDTDYDDDDYTSGGESTGTGRISGTSEFGDTQPDVKATTADAETGAASVSPWSDFTASKHVPILEDPDNAYMTERTNEPSTIPSEHQASENGDTAHRTDENDFIVYDDSTQENHEIDRDLDAVTPLMPRSYDENEPPRPRYIPLPPEDYEPPVRYVKDPAEVAQNRLPFMTPIVEKTESSLGAFTVRSEKDYFNAKTPSRKANDYPTPLIDEEVLSSPFREIVNEARPPQVPKLRIASAKLPPVPVPESEGFPIIQDTQCNPVDDSIRRSILEAIQPTLSSYGGFHDYRPSVYNKAPEIRKYINALKKTRADGKNTTSLSLPPSLGFAEAPSKLYTIKRELGKGAFAPVYLAEEEEKSTEEEDCHNCNASPNSFLAIKCEDPPTSWEFYIMSALNSRLSPSPTSSPPFHPSTLQSLCKPIALHLFQDEAYLLETYLDQGTLLDLVNLAKADPTAINNQTTLDEPIAMFFTIELLRTVESMHSAGVLHGDLKADNCLVRLSPLTSSASLEEGWWDPQYSPDGSGGWSAKGLSLIDFGRGIDLRAFRTDVQFLADWKTGKQDCVEMRELRPWTYQVDYWGLAGVVHSLLFGKYIEDITVEEPTVRWGSAASAGGGFDEGDDEDDDEDTAGPSGSLHEGEKTTSLGLPGRNRKRYRIREALKRYWQTELWASLFDVLLNPGSCAEGMPCVNTLRGCRERMEAWLVGEGGRKNGGLKAGLLRLEGRIREQRRR